MRAFTLFVIAFLVYGVIQAQENTSSGIEFKPDRLKFKVILDRCGSKKVKALNNGTTSIVDPVFSIPGTNEFRVEKSFRNAPIPSSPHKSAVCISRSVRIT